MATMINGVNFTQVGKDALEAARVLLDDPATWKSLKDIVQNVADGFTAEAYDGPEGRGIMIPTDAVFHPIRRCRTIRRSPRPSTATSRGTTAPSR